MKIKKIHFTNYKAFSKFTVELSDFDVLVGPNNAGKSTIVGSLRLLAEGIRKANSRKAVLVPGPTGQAWGHQLDLRDIPVSLENVFHNYDEGEPARITFTLENGNSLLLYFPEREVCVLFPESQRLASTPAHFRREFPIRIGLIPILGPVEHQESLYKPEAARLALLTHRASRNFRNIWYHNPDQFEEFREMIRTTWVGMDIEPPKLETDADKPYLAMFCPEERIPREIYWEGFGFQIWCQLLTSILLAKQATTVVIDEPDIYLHSDLQRQLVGILKGLERQVLIATHSIEIIREADAPSIVTVNKTRNHSTRIANTSNLVSVYKLLGTNAHATLTQLAKTHRVLFVEGADYKIVSLFAKRLNQSTVATRSQFAVVEVDGFNPQKVKDYTHAFELTLGAKIATGVLFDRDYRPVEEVKDIVKGLSTLCDFAVIHRRKEIENFLLNPKVIDRAVSSAMARQAERKSRRVVPPFRSIDVLNRLAEECRTEVLSQYLARRRTFLQRKTRGLDGATIDKSGIKEFEAEWGTQEGKFRLVPGKEILSRFNTELQKSVGVSITQHSIIQEFKNDEIDSEIVDLVRRLAQFSR